MVACAFSRSCWNLTRFRDDAKHCLTIVFRPISANVDGIAADLQAHCIQPSLLIAAHDVGVLRFYFLFPHASSSLRVHFFRKHVDIIIANGKGCNHAFAYSRLYLNFCLEALIGWIWTFLKPPAPEAARAAAAFEAPAAPVRAAIVLDAILAVRVYG